MSQRTHDIVRTLISALVNGLLGSAGILLDNLAQAKGISKTTMAVVMVTGGVLMLKDIQAYLSKPPNFTPSGDVLATQ